MEELHEIKLELECLLGRILDRASVDAIGISSILCDLDEVTDLGFDKDVDGDEIRISEGLVEELFF